MDKKIKALISDRPIGIGHDLPEVMITTAHTLRKRGEAHPQAKLADADADTIRRMLAAGSSQRYIASIFGISQSLVKRIKAGQR